jgi:hypothetical protein
MKASRIAAKVAVRLFLFLVLLAFVPFVTGNSTWDIRMHNTYLAFPNKWALAYPILLIGGFIALFIKCTIQKYSHTETNWLLVLTTTVLIVYGIRVYILLYYTIIN